MSETIGDFGIISKMDPMARRALSQVESMQNAIQHNNRDDVAKHLEAAQNALAQLKSDLICMTDCRNLLPRRLIPANFKSPLETYINSNQKILTTKVVRMEL